MICHTIFAIISECEVKNVVVGEFEPCNQVARLDYGDEAYAVEVTQYPVQIGDFYEGGVFYREVNGEEVRIDPIPTDSQKIDMLTAENASLRAYLNDISMAVTELAEGEA